MGLGLMTDKISLLSVCLSVLLPHNQRSSNVSEVPMSATLLVSAFPWCQQNSSVDILLVSED
jgi:hypothetical protein